MDCVYICRPGDNEELRYSIRSVVKNFPHSKIWLVGHRPDWFVGDFLEVKDVGRKFDNIKNCYKAIIDCDEISDEFVMMNDDFFVVRTVDKLEPMYGGLLEDRAAEYQELAPTSLYTRLLKQTLVSIKKRGIRVPLDYDMHVPMAFRKAELSYILDIDAMPRSTYGNFYNLGGVKIKDVKVYISRRLQQRSFDFESSDFPYISTDDSSFSIVYDKILKDMFSEPCTYEYPRQDSNLRRTG